MAGREERVPLMVERWEWRGGGRVVADEEEMEEMEEGRGRIEEGEGKGSVMAEVEREEWVKYVELGNKRYGTLSL